MIYSGYLLKSIIYTLSGRNLWLLEGQTAYPQKTFRETGKLRRIEKITPPNLMAFK